MAPEVSKGRRGFLTTQVRLGFVSGSLIPDLHKGDFLQAAKDVPVSAKVLKRQVSKYAFVDKDTARLLSSQASLYQAGSCCFFLGLETWYAGCIRHKSVPTCVVTVFHLFFSPILMGTSRFVFCRLRFVIHRSRQLLLSRVRRSPRARVPVVGTSALFAAALGTLTRRKMTILSIVILLLVMFLSASRGSSSKSRPPRGGRGVSSSSRQPFRGGGKSFRG